MFLAILFSLSFALPASAQHDQHAVQEASAPAAPSASSVSAHTADDLQFLSHMIVHHQQAIDMGALVPARSARAELQRFARYIAGAQAAEIVMMSGMLDRAAEPAPAHDHGMRSADPPMAGMLSSVEMAALAAASGAEFERLWLTGMIFHHEGGLAMARVQELAQLEGGRRPHGLEVMVQEILDVQRAEVTQMKQWLGEWSLVAADEPDAREPAAEVSIPAPGATLRAGEATTIYGVAVDDRDVAGVQIAIQDLSTEEWLRADGTWGEQELLAAERIGSGPASAAWRYAWTPPAGRFAISVEVRDDAGKSGTTDAREISVE